ncbi:hypothetical protein GCM10011331_20030 [Flavimobilis marinus]|nr:hypothetical protein GCM10011331_20030 [Flavimobilis marinus]
MPASKPGLRAGTRDRAPSVTGGPPSVKGWDGRLTQWELRWSTTTPRPQARRMAA